MRKIFIKNKLLILSSFLIVTVFIFAYSMSQNFYNKSKVLDNSGGKTSSSNYQNKFSMGQPSAIGESESANLKNSSGFIFHLKSSFIDKTPPSPPQDLSVILIGYSEAKLMWRKNLENDMARYNIYRAENKDADYVLINYSLAGYNIFYDKDIGLDESKTFWYKITAVDKSENESDLSKSEAVTADRRMPGDDNFDFQTNYETIKLPEAWLHETGKTNSIIIAIIDSGIDFEHPDLNLKAVEGYNFTSDNTDIQDKYGHGTNMGSIAAAVTNNSTELEYNMAGVCWEAMLMPVKVYTGTEFLSLWTRSQEISEGIRYAADNHADIINISLAARNDNDITEAIKYAYENGREGKGCIIIASSGNGYWHVIDDVRFPANLDNVIAVSATLKDGNTIWEDSCHGPEVDVAAPGDNILVANINDTYKSTSGTSEAAAHVSGLAALILSKRPDLGPEDVREIIINSADNTKGEFPYEESDKIGLEGRPLKRNDYYGFGLINAYKALELASSYSSNFAMNIVSANIIGSNNLNYDPNAAFGPPDNKSVSLGVGGNIILDMGIPGIQDKDGKDLRIHEAIEGFHETTNEYFDDEGIIVFVSNDVTSWNSLGVGIGTCEFDLSVSSLNSARYVKIVDDGDGDSLSTSPGYDLDAVEVIIETTIKEVHLLTSIPTSFTLFQNYPNPFNPVTNIKYQLPKQCHVNLKIYNTFGQEVRTLIDEMIGAGYHSILWDGKDNFGEPVSSDLYFYRIETDEYIEVHKMLLIK